MLGQPRSAAFDFSGCRTASTALLCCNAIVRKEVLEATQRQKRKKKLRYKLDLVTNLVVTRAEFYPTWTLLPAPISHIDVLEVDCRIQDNHRDRPWDVVAAKAKSKKQYGRSELWGVALLQGIMTLIHDLLVFGLEKGQHQDPFRLSIGTLKLNFTWNANGRTTLSRTRTIPQLCKINPNQTVFDFVSSKMWRTSTTHSLLYCLRDLKCGKTIRQQAKGKPWANFKAEACEEDFLREMFKHAQEIEAYNEKFLYWNR